MFHLLLLSTGGVWAGDWVLKALAIAMQRCIITISTSSLCLFTPHVTPMTGGAGKVAASNYPATYGRVQRDLPVEALAPRLWFMMYDGIDHFWPAMSTGPPRTASYVQRAGMNVHD